MEAELIRVVVVDDNHAMLARATSALNSTCHVVGTAHDGPSALKIILALQPDVAVLDISMPGMSGLEVAASLRRAGSSAAIVFLSIHSEKEFIDAARAVGGIGYVFKTCLASDLSKAVLAASAHEQFVSLER
jgi:DNA-binding NarL/FixJ family response regulator